MPTIPTTTTTTGFNMLQFDFNQATQFLASIPRTAGYGFRVIHPDRGGKLPKSQWYASSELEQALPWLAEYNEKGYGVYVGINDTIGTNQSHVKGVSAYFIDIDDPEEVNTANLEQLLDKLPPSMVVQSSREGKLHYYWCLAEVEPQAMGSFTSIQQTLIKLVNSDEVVQDLPRIMRLPGFYHTKSEPVITKVIETNCHRYTTEHIATALKELGSPVVEAKKPVKQAKAVGFKKAVTPTPEAKVATPEEVNPAKETYRTRSEKLIDSVFRAIVTAEEGKRNITLYNKAYSVMWFYTSVLDKHSDIAEKVKDALLTAGSLAGLTEAECEATFESALIGYHKAVEEGVYEVPDSIGKSAKTQLAIEHHLGNKLAYNRRTQQYLKDGVEFNLDDLRVDLEAETLQDLEPKSFYNKVTRLAKAQSFDPFEQYLLSVAPLQPASLSEVAARMFGTQEQPELVEAYLKCFLVGTVKRVIEPGCKHDTVLILSGDQGAYKTTLFKTLASAEYFTSLPGDVEDRQKVRQCQGNVIVEMGEIDYAFSKKAQSKLKQDLSETVDEVRTLFTEQVEKTPRAYVFVGTTNETDILLDATGDRRYHVVKLPQGYKVDIAWVTANRDAIWSLAYKLYLEGAASYLTEVEEAARAQHNQQFHQVSALAEEVSNLIHNLEQRCDVAVQLSTLTRAMGLSNPTKAQEKEVTATLASLGYVRKPKRFNGQLVKVFMRPDANPTAIVTTDNIMSARLNS